MLDISMAFSNYTIILIFLQVGRSTESPIDFVVTDTISGSQNNDETQITQSTISRFACRIVCDRSPPYTARIFAAGFDSSKNIFLGVSSTNICYVRANSGFYSVLFSSPKIPLY